VRHLEPLLVLFLFPVIIGIASQVRLRDARKASLVATLGSILAVYACLEARDPDGTWNGLAAFLVLPLPIAFALVAVFICHGHPPARPRRWPR
jgi:hypothetical protein